MAVQTIIIPGSGSFSFGVPGGTQISPTLIAAGSAILPGLIDKLLPGDQGPRKDFTQAGGSNCDPQCAPGFTWSSAKGCCVKTRRRRRRMLTCSDRQDIAFITATLGKGDMAKSAIGSLLAGGCR